MNSLYLAPISLLGMIGSVLELRWAHRDVWFFAFIIFLVLFVLSVADVAKKYMRISEKHIPVSVHVLAAILFVFGVAASIYGLSNPEYSALDLGLIPFIMAGSVYLAFMVIKIKLRL
jgi:predicted membrane channel-forming protein YqfA (hemolysin III family)